MMQKAGQYKVSIFGEHYTVRSDESPDNIVQAAELVDSTMKEISSKAHLDAKSIAILAALRLAYQVQNYSDHKVKEELLVSFIDRELEGLGFDQVD
jgi:cell division protein ZapA (FtsZ GTPase activity inhibitor)